MNDFLLVLSYLTVFIALVIMLYIYVHKRHYIGANFHSRFKYCVIKKPKYFCRNSIFQNGEMLFLERGIAKRETLPPWNQWLEKTHCQLME